MKSFPLSAQLNSSNIHFLDSLNVNHSLPLPFVPVMRKKKPISRIRANEDLRTKTEYQANVLRLLDDLNAPLLMLPRVGQGSDIKQIGFFTDLRFTGSATLAAVAKIAQTFKAGIVLFNISESHLPSMEPAYAEKYFKKQELEEINGIPVKLVNLNKPSKAELENIFNDYHIDMLTAMQGRKNLLYNLVA
ncbi:MAG TPA: hypothetical protein VGD90_11250 [Sphingobacteriaceae bacterium]